MATIYSKLINVQSELKAPKGQFNKFGNYNYRNCEDILEAVKPLLKTNNLTVVINDEIVIVGTRTYVKAIVRLIDTENGEQIETSAYAREEESKKGMDGSQVTGASSSYARKYALNGLFCIDDTKDSDTTNTPDKGKSNSNNSQKPSTPQSDLITEAQLKRLFAMSKGMEEACKVVIAKYGYSSSKYIKKVDYEKICQEIEKL